ncbi:MAG: gamma carbonic anhydrase family protein [Desulfarculaceae bacterium]|nr:gamma carbonic anhydrase family protein [Desulfarculaceae bacterium]MCF8071239.1 gamma carbonic anhydrase family protein [Desulfarculaceae bacterium]MCF8101158.1 gamma carbonic anhydrase family protein [Desulfarculaceae bacterium]MCF8115293.1 gamma carbonic anhydrase family protein [Desulfarculaceae bacterium]
MADKALLTPFREHSPRLGAGVFVDPSARLLGQVDLADGAMVWPGAVLRADDDRIEIGRGSAVLDLALVEAPLGKPVIVEPGALVSHQVCLHGATVKTGALVGIGAIVLDGAVVGSGALVGAGAVVPPRMEVPEGVLVLGQPAKVIRELKPAEREEVSRQLADLAAKAKVYLEQMG